MIKKIVTRSLIMLFILIFTCEIGLRIRLAYLYRDPAFLLYHQFKLRSQDEIAKEKPHYYRKNMFKPFTLIYREEEPRQRKNIRELWDSVVDSLRFWYEDFVGTDIYHKGVEQRVTYEFPFKFENYQIQISFQFQSPF